MRVLVFSDIHNNLEHVELLREREANEFDAVIVAGDIGDRILPDFIRLVDSFGCPVYLIYGNWDRKCDYSLPPNRNCVLLNHNVEQCGDFYITGFSGCPSGWGNNPLFKEILSETVTDAAPELALVLNRERLIETVRAAGVPEERLVVVTHERLAWLADHGLAPLLHIHGHVHRYSFRQYKGTWYLNAAALDAGSSSIRTRRKPEPEGYCVVDMAPGRVEVERRLLLE